MAVYVDSSYKPVNYTVTRYGRTFKTTLMLCHMLADTEEELERMARAIGAARKWRHETPFPHYDIGRNKRVEALALGAIEIDRRAVALMVRAFKQAKKIGAPT